MDDLVHRPVPGLPAGWLRLFSIARLLGPSITNYTSMSYVQVLNRTIYEMASITFRSSTRGRYSLSGRCLGEHRNWYSSTRGGNRPASAGGRGTSTRLCSLSTGGRYATHCGSTTASMLWALAGLVRTPRMGMPSR